jgi:hypothetical protein
MLAPISDATQNSTIATQILSDIQILITKDSDASGTDNDLEDAAESVQRYIEKNKGTDSTVSPDAATSPRAQMGPVFDTAGVTDTGVLTGPLNGLKNFLVKNATDRQS